MVELVYKLDEKSYRECLKGESIAKVRFFVHKHIYRHMDTSPDHITPCSRMHVQGNDMGFKVSWFKDPPFLAYL